jgi:hypothetical protein
MSAVAELSSYQGRLAICRACEHLLKTELPKVPLLTPIVIERCGKCGCPIQGRSAFGSCPAGKF